MKGDSEYEEHRIERVEPAHPGWTIYYDKATCFYVPPESPIVPVVGMVARFYPGGLGRMVRGLLLGGQVVFYRTPAEEETRYREWITSEERKRADELERDRLARDARIAALVYPLRARVHRLINRKPSFRRDSEIYEVFVCEQAQVIASHLGTVEAIERWRKLGWKEQIAVAPISDEHSGTTLGAAVHLASLLVSGRYTEIMFGHGALAPLVGCRDYGCHGFEEQAS